MEPGKGASSGWIQMGGTFVPSNDEAREPILGPKALTHWRLPVFSRRLMNFKGTSYHAKSDASAALVGAIVISAIVNAVVVRPEQGRRK